MKPIAEIVADVCKRASVDVKRIYARDRGADAVLARDEICFLAHSEGHSYPKIAKALCRADHSTILMAARRHERRMRSGRGK